MIFDCSAIDLTKNRKLKKRKMIKDKAKWYKIVQKCSTFGKYVRHVILLCRRKIEDAKVKNVAKCVQMMPD
jgi:hypothetical protein